MQSVLSLLGGRWLQVQSPAQTAQQQTQPQPQQQPPQQQQPAGVQQQPQQPVTAVPPQQTQQQQPAQQQQQPQTQPQQPVQRQLLWPIDSFAMRRAVSAVPPAAVTVRPSLSSCPVHLICFLFF
jgi:hypothetical protein